MRDYDLLVENNKLHVRHHEMIYSSLVEESIAEEARLEEVLLKGLKARRIATILFMMCVCQM